MMRHDGLIARRQTGGIKRAHAEAIAVVQPASTIEAADTQGVRQHAPHRTGTVEVR